MGLLFVLCMNDHNKTAPADEILFYIALHVIVLQTCFLLLNAKIRNLSYQQLKDESNKYQGRIQGGRTRCAPPLKLEKI